MKGMRLYSFDDQCVRPELLSASNTHVGRACVCGLIREWAAAEASIDIFLMELSFKLHHLPTCTVAFFFFYVILQGVNVWKPTYAFNPDGDETAGNASKEK